MADGWAQRRLANMGIGYSLRPFGLEGMPLCEVLHWTDLLTHGRRLHHDPCKALEEFMAWMGLHAIPRLDTEDGQILVGIALAIRVPDPLSLARHVLARMRIASENVCPPMDTPLSILLALSERHPSVGPDLAEFSRDRLRHKRPSLGSENAVECLRTLGRWGQPADLPLIGEMLELEGLHVGIEALRGMLGIHLRHPTLGSRLTHVPESWRERAAVLEGGSPACWDTLLTGLPEVVHSSGYLVQDYLRTRPDTSPHLEMLFEMILERFFDATNPNGLPAYRRPLGAFLKRLGPDAARAILDSIRSSDVHMETYRSGEILQILARLDPGPESIEAVSPFLDGFENTDDLALRRTAFLVRALLKGTELPFGVMEVLLEQAPWHGDLTDPDVSFHIQAREAVVQPGNTAPMLRLAFGSDGPIPSWIRSWQASRLACLHPHLRPLCEEAVSSAAMDERRPFGAVACALIESPVRVSPILLGCALGLGNATALPDTEATAGELLGLLHVEWLEEQALSYLYRCGPVVRRAWHAYLSAKTRPIGDNEFCHLDVAHQLFTSGASGNDPIALLRPEWSDLLDIDPVRGKLQRLGIDPASEPVETAWVLVMLPEQHQMDGVLGHWTRNVEGSVAAWNALLSRNDAVGELSAARLANMVPAAFWEGGEGKRRASVVTGRLCQSDWRTATCALQAVNRWGLTTDP